MIFIHLWLISRPTIFLSWISDLVLCLLGIFSHTLEDTALFVRLVPGNMAIKGLRLGITVYFMQGIELGLEIVIC